MAFCLAETSDVDRRRRFTWEDYSLFLMCGSVVFVEMLEESLSEKKLWIRIAIGEGNGRWVRRLFQLQEV